MVVHYREVELPGGLVGHVWQPNDDPVGCVVIYHGYAAHGRYGTILFAAEMLASNGFVVVSGDLHGCGKSPGTPGFIESVDSVLADCVSIGEYARQKFPNVGRFVMGSSMGGNFALRVTMLQPDLYSGAVLLAPMVKIENKPPAWQMPVLELLASVPLIRSIGLLKPKGLDSDKQYRDPDRRAVCDNDPLGFHGAMCLATGRSLIEASLQLEASLDKIKVPFLVVHGDADEIVPLDGSRLLLQKAQSADKHLEVYPGMLHAPLCELPDTRALVEQLILDWLRARL